MADETQLRAFGAAVAAAAMTDTAINLAKALHDADVSPKALVDAFYQSIPAQMEGHTIYCTPASPAEQAAVIRYAGEVVDLLYDVLGQHIADFSD